MCLNEQNEDQGRQGASESVCTTHSHELTALALSARGTMVATASTKVMDLSIILILSSMDHIKLFGSFGGNWWWFGHLVICKAVGKM